MQLLVLLVMTGTPFHCRQYSWGALARDRVPITILQWLSIRRIVNIVVAATWRPLWMIILLLTACNRLRPEIAENQKLVSFL